MPQPRLSFTEFATPKLVDTPPSGEGWLHEIKQDGYRTQLILENGQVRAYSRSGLDWTDRYPVIVEAASRLKATSAILDGEMIVADAAGRSDFHALLRSIKSAPEALTFVAFDLMHLDGEDLRSRPLTERRRLLEKLVNSTPSQAIIFSRAYGGEGADVFAAIEQLGLEGIVSKRETSPYRSGDRAGWLKTKSFELGQFDVIGIDKTPGGAPVALLAKDGRFMGQGFIALDRSVRDAFWRFVEAEKQDTSPVQGLRKRGASWIRPGMTAIVKHLRGEPEMLRHASVIEITLPRARKSRFAVESSRATKSAGKGKTT